MQVLEDISIGYDDRLPPYQLGELFKELAKYDNYIRIYTFLEKGLIEAQRELQQYSKVRISGDNFNEKK